MYNNILMLCMRTYTNYRGIRRSNKTLDKKKNFMKKSVTMNKKLTVQSNNGHVKA